MYGPEIVGRNPAGFKFPRRKKTIPKSIYERVVKSRARKIAAKRTKVVLTPENYAKIVPTPKDYARAKYLVNANLAKHGVTVAGDDLLGVSDIMGAAYVMGAAAKGDPAARRAVAKTVRAARAGSPSARKQVRAMTAAKAAAVRAASPRRGWLSFGKPYFASKVA